MKGQRRCEWKRTLEGCERRMGCIDGRPRCIFRLLIIRNFSTRCDSEKSSGEKSEKQETVVHQCPLWMHNTSTLDLQPFPFRMGAERSGKSVFNGEWRVSVSSLWSRSSPDQNSCAHSVFKPRKGGEIGRSIIYPASSLSIAFGRAEWAERVAWRSNTR